MGTTAGTIQEVQKPATRATDITQGWAVGGEGGWEEKGSRVKPQNSFLTFIQGKIFYNRKPQIFSSAK